MHPSNACLTAILPLTIGLSAGLADDWPQWRGADRDGAAAQHRGVHQRGVAALRLHEAEALVLHPLDDGAVQLLADAGFA